MDNFAKMLSNVKGDIGVDIDDTMILLGPHLITYMNNLFSDILSRPFSERDAVIHGMEKIKLLKDAGITKEKILYMLKRMESDGFIEKIMPSDICIDSLKIMSKHHSIDFITSRYGFYDDAIGMTSRWHEALFKKTGFKARKIIYNHEKHEENHIGLFFDDNPYFVVEMLRKGKPVVLFDMSSNRMNSHDASILPEEFFIEKKLLIEEIEKYNDTLLFRVSGWKDVHDALLSSQRFSP